MTPEWAAVLGDGYPAFRAALDDAMAALGVVADPAHIDHGVLHTQDHGRLGLQNVVRLCASAPRDAWPRVIADHLRRATAKAVPLDWATALPNLRVRIVPDRLVESGGRYVTRPFADQLQLAIAIDKPEHVVYATPDDTERWALPLSDVFDAAIERTRAEPDLARDEIEGLTVLHGDSYFVASHVLFLERYVPPPAHGALVGLPDRHSLIVLPIHDGGFLGALGPLLAVTHGRFSEQPGAITDQLYWRRGESYVRIPGGIGKDGPWIAPPDEFNEMVTGLSRN